MGNLADKNKELEVLEEDTLYDEDETLTEEDTDTLFDENDTDEDDEDSEYEDEDSEDEDEDLDESEDEDSIEDDEDSEDDEDDLWNDDIEETDGETAMDKQLDKIVSDLVLEQKEIDVEDIILPTFKKISRQKTIKGLSGLIRQWDVVSPIHVLALETEGTFMLLDGLRRLAATMSNGNKKIPAIIWNFEDKAEGKENANILALMINRAQKYDISEQWDMLQVLKKKGNISPTLCEYLLQLEPGDAMKLEDVMTAEGDYDDIREKLLIGKLTIDGAYKKLNNARKKEDRLEKDDELNTPDTDGKVRGKKKGASKEGISDVIDPNDAGEDDEEYDTEDNLSMEEVQEILEMSGNVDDADLDAVEDRSEEARGEEVQDKKNRHPLDKDLRTAILNRDKFTCQCCGNGGMSYLPILTVHHRVPVAAGGPDKEENLITLCQNCHMRLHVYTMKGLRVNKDEVTEEELATLKKIYFYGNEALDAFKKKGIKKAEKDKIMEKGTRHAMPGEGLKDNNEAYSKKDEYSDEEIETEIETEDTETIFDDDEE